MSIKSNTEAVRGWQQVPPLDIMCLQGLEIDICDIFLKLCFPFLRLPKLPKTVYQQNSLEGVQILIGQLKALPEANYNTLKYLW